MRAFCKNEFQIINHTKEFVQINHSYNIKKGTVRGMHFQLPPFVEIKLIRCIRGAIHDTIIDIRKDSPTFLQQASFELSEENNKMIYVPEGFAHGFQTLTDNTHMIYHHTAFYTPNAYSGLRHDDPLLNVKWSLPISSISEQDKNFKLLDYNFKGI